MTIQARVEAARMRLGAFGQLELATLVLCGVGYLAHYLWYTVGERNWFIEDAGISFAYARNFIRGHGLVPYVGGERVEGFSNPLWTLLVALFYAIGVDGWISAKLLGAVLGLATLPVVWLLARRALGGSTTARGTALVGPALLAASPQFVVWNTSGLENSLFCFLLVAGLLRLSSEAASADKRPVSALLFFLLATTRPEGAMYGAVAWVAVLVVAIRDRRWARLVVWSLLFAIPVALYEAARIAYFAWPLPNTYYAKLGIGDRFQPWKWTGRGWRYLRDYLGQYQIQWALPFVLVALTGFEARRRRLALGTLAILLLFLIWDGDIASTYGDLRRQIADLNAGLAEQLPRNLRVGSVGRILRLHWGEARVVLLLVAGIGMGLLTLAGSGGYERALLWAACAAAAFYPIYVGGDWMKAFRWVNPLTVTLFPLLGVGLGRVLDDGGRLAWRIPLPRLRGPPLLAVLAIVAVGALDYVAGKKSREFWAKPETTVRNIQKRVQYMKDVQRDLEIDHVTLLDVDMGAHMLYTDWQIVDIAGLIDLPMAHHPKYDVTFLDEYLFEERKPEFAHVHGGWARTSGIDKRPAFKEGYLEIPGYPAGGRSLHVGNHIRKDLLVVEGQPAGPTTIRLQGGISLDAWEVPSPIVAQGGQLYVHTLWSGQRKDDFRVLLFLDDGAGHRTATMFLPGHGYYAPSEWKDGEAVEGHLRIQIPEDFPLGEYRLGLVVLDGPSGAVLPIEGTSELATAPIYLAGEVELPQSARIVSRDDARVEAENDVARAIDLAQDDRDCEAGWRAWKEATWHATRSFTWQDHNRVAVERAMAHCWVGRAQEATSEADRIADLLTARRFDPENDEIARLAVPLAETRNAEGEKLRAAGDAFHAYLAYRDAVQLDPRRSWSRRRAEEMRDVRLGLGAAAPDKPKSIKTKSKAAD
jgi:hypothetical protein